MDPASATVAFVGFAASLATVAAVVVDSSRTLHDVYKSVKNAPREIQRMDQKSKRLHKMILEVQRMSEDLHDGEPPPFIHEFWLEHAGKYTTTSLSSRRKSRTFMPESPKILRRENI
jgi:hypothetical protein